MCVCVCVLGGGVFLLVEIVVFINFTRHTHIKYVKVTIFHSLKTFDNFR